MYEINKELQDTLEKMSLPELKVYSDNFRSKDNFSQAIPYLQEIFRKEPTGWNAFYLTQAYRKSSYFDNAREIIDKVKSVSLSFKPILNEELWLDYGQKIKDWNNSELLSDAEDLLNRSDKYDKYTGSVFSKTVLSVVKKLIYDKEDLEAKEWLEKLEPEILSKTPFVYQGQKYPSDQKTFYVQYADVIIKLNQYSIHLKNLLSKLKFKDQRQIDFLQYILKNVTYEDYNGNKQITRLGYALYLKNFNEEIYNRTNNNFKNIFNPEKITLVSDLGDFEFCPVSFAIRETFEISSNSSWEKDEWHGDKKTLVERYDAFSKNENFDDAFEDTDIDVTDIVKKDFEEILFSFLIHSSTNPKSQKYFFNLNQSLIGNPDYVFQTPNDKRFVLIEKFTKGNYKYSSLPFQNDLAKLYAYMHEMVDLKLDYGILLYWFWEFSDITDSQGKPKKKIRVKSYQIFKFEKTDANLETHLNLFKRVNGFKDKAEMKIEGQKISVPAKCLNCSVVSYCNHKTGNYNVIKIPYEINELQIASG